MAVNYAHLQTGKTAYGTVEGNGVEAIDVEVGFRPKYVRLMNVESMVSVEWFDGMDDGDGIQLANEDNGGGTDLVFKALSANGVSVNDRGFTIGVGDVNVNGEDIFYYVIG